MLYDRSRYLHMALTSSEMMPVRVNGSASSTAAVREQKIGTAAAPEVVVAVPAVERGQQQRAVPGHSDAHSAEQTRISSPEHSRSELNAESLCHAHIMMQH